MIGDRHHAIVISDLHAGLRLPHARLAPDATTSDRLDDVLDVLSQVRCYADTNAITRVYILGDLFDRRHPDAPTLIRTAEALRALARGGLPRRVCLLPGNHDAHDRAGRVYSIDLFDVLKSPGIEVMGHGWRERRDGLTLHAVPWLPGPLFRQRVQALTLAPGRNVLMFHQAVKGARDGDYVTLRGVEREVFSRFELALSGHIHEAQALDEGRIRYLGAPLHLRFSDAGRACAFWVLDERELSLTAVPVRAPPFVRWRFHADAERGAAEVVAQELPGQVEAFLEERRRFDRPAYLEVVVEGARADVDAGCARIQRLTDALEGRFLRRVRLARVYTDAGASARLPVPGAISSPEALVDAFVQVAEGGAQRWPAGVSAEALARFGREMLSP